MPMTPEAKSALSGSIRKLRERLLHDLHEETRSEYRLSVVAGHADLPEAKRVGRARLESWLEEQVRAERRGGGARDREAFLRELEQRAAYTLLNRLVLLRVMEGMGLRAELVLSRGWNSPGYQAFREMAPALVRDDPSEGYAYLLQLVFEDLALDLPGLYGSAGHADLIPVGAATLRHLVEALDAPELASCWDDDMTLGWVYQYWNDPEREALDKKLNAGGKVQPHEIASKTQMFTERCMVDWLLQNSLGPMWLAMCRKQGWTADCELTLPDEPEPTAPAVGWVDEGNPASTAPGSDPAPSPAPSADPSLGFVPQPSLRRLLRVLDQRRADWRAKRDAGEVSLTDLMPLHSDAERRWAYFVPQPIPAVAVEKAPDTVRDLRLLDPAVGSGHFLVVAFDLLFALYQEEARHRGEADAPDWSERAIVERILAHNLHGIDLDPRAVQIAAAALWLKARRTCPEARPERLNLVASNLRLAGLPDDDPALLELRREVERETGIPAGLTDTLLQALTGADHLGSLLQIDKAVEEAIEQHETELGRGEPRQLSLLDEEEDSLTEARRHGGGAGRMGKATRAHHSSGISADSLDEEGSHTEARRHGEDQDRSGKATRADQSGVPSINLDGEKSHAPRRKPHGSENKELRVSVSPCGNSSRDREQTKADILERLEAFLARHSGGEDLGLRLHGEQLAAGVRFLRMLKPGSYDLVVGNPPYQGTSKMADAAYIKAHYPKGKADLYAAFLLRGLQLARQGGTSALLTMRNWMFIKQYADLRIWLLERFDLRALGDFAIGAFDEVPNDVLSVVVSVFRRVPPASEQSVASQPTPPDDRSYDRERTRRKRASVMCAVGQCAFMPNDFRRIPQWPVPYWWDCSILFDYLTFGLLGHHSPGRVGMTSSDSVRFTRNAWEIGKSRNWRWAPFLNGAEGLAWLEPVRQVANWNSHGLEVKTYTGLLYGSHTRQIRNEDCHFRLGVAFSMIGQQFAARVHRIPSIFGDKGSSIFPDDISNAVCLLNSSRSREILSALNPSISFQVGDVNRLPLRRIDSADKIFLKVEEFFTESEFHREPSVEFKHPGPSPWQHAQAWAQAAVDRPDGELLPPYKPEYNPEPPTDHLSFALGVALGRFGGGEGLGGWGILDPASADLSHALPAGILFLDGTLDTNDRHDGLGEPAAEVLHKAWTEHGAAVDAKSNLRIWLRLKFFKDVHKGMYDNRPIHWPLSSAKRSFVAWINIHRWNARTLPVLLADHLQPALKRLEGEIADLRTARDGADRRAANAAEKRYAAVMRWRDELAAFIADVEQCAYRGAPPTDAQCPERERDATYAPDLDDGVMINSAALWPLLETQWKDPKKWWKELATAKGKKDYDWSHLAMRHWPARVDAKCQADPSLGVAHGCFWAYHPARAWAWELRMQDEISADFRIQEAPYRGDGGDTAHRAAYLDAHWEDALAAVTKEVLRRRRKQKTPQAELCLLETGLCSEHPVECWQLELGLIHKQETDFHLRAPDEAEARAVFERDHPELVSERKALLRSLMPIEDLMASVLESDTGDEAEIPADLEPESRESGG